MSKSNPSVQKTLLLAQMQADREALVSNAPPRVPTDFRLSPELKPWAIPAALFAVSLLKMPPAIKAPLRALAVLMLKNRVQEVVRVAQASDRHRPVTADLQARRATPRDVPVPGVVHPAPSGRNDPVTR